MVANYETVAPRLADSHLATRAKPTHHLHDLWVYIISDDAALSGDVFEHFMESLGLNLLALEF